MADAAQKHKKVEYGVHVSTLVNTIKYGASDITHSLGDNPYQRTGWNTVDQRFESNEHTETHRNETDGFQMTVRL